MKIGLLGKKIGMTQIFEADNRCVPVTVVEAGPCPIVHKKTEKTDGYDAIQLGFGAQKLHRLSKAMKGHLKKAQVQAVSHLKEVRTEGESEQKVGEVLTVSVFKAGQKVDVICFTKGHGFQGVVKRHGFSGGPASHGSMSHRRGGSYGQCQWPGEVDKGHKMPGRMGNARRTIQNLKIVKILEKKNLLLIKGNLPGAKGATVLICSAKKVSP